MLVDDSEKRGEAGDLWRYLDRFFTKSSTDASLKDEIFDSPRMCSRRPEEYPDLFKAAAQAFSDPGQQRVFCSNVRPDLLFLLTESHPRPRSTSSPSSRTQSLAESAKPFFLRGPGGEVCGGSGGAG